MEEVILICGSREGVTATGRHSSEGLEQEVERSHLNHTKEVESMN